MRPATSRITPSVHVPIVCSWSRGKTTTSIAPCRSSSVTTAIVAFAFVTTVRLPVTTPPTTTRCPSSDSSFRSPEYAVTKWPIRSATSPSGWSDR